MIVSMLLMTTLMAAEFTHHKARGMTRLLPLATTITTTVSFDMFDKLSPRLGAIIFGGLIFFAYFLIPDPNAPITNAPWPHKWIHAYCNHALLLVHADQAEDGGCQPGPITPYSMSYYQMLAKYPVYGIILNMIPYTYPVIVGFLVVAALPERIFTRRTSAVPDEPAKRAF